MQTKLARQLGIDFPIFAFTHCRDVVAAVTNSGGFGVLGATGFTPEQLEIELSWIDEKVGNKPYGVDVIIPRRYEGQEEKGIERQRAKVRAAIPDDYYTFARSLLDAGGVPPLPPGKVLEDRLSMTDAVSTPLVDIALGHKNCRLIANALGTPPAEVISQVKSAGVMIGALCGSAKHAQYHVDADLDFIIAQGGEGGGHTGTIGSVVLWPQVVDIAGDIPVLAAGGIGSGRQMLAALASGAQGVWCGSVWLTTTEAETTEAAKQAMFRATSSDTVRSRSFTGKPVRMLRNAWTDAWDAPGNPESLGAPMQMMMAGESLLRVSRHPEKSQDFAFNPVGQIVGAMNSTISARDQVMTMVNEYLAACDHINSLLPES